MERKCYGVHCKAAASTNIEQHRRVFESSDSTSNVFEWDSCLSSVITPSTIIIIYIPLWSFYFPYFSYSHM